MKKTLILAALMLIWVGPANSGELKVQIPVNDYEKIQSRLDALENENSRLKQEVNSLESNSTPPAPETSASAQPSEEMLERLSALEKENSQLKQEVEVMQNAPEPQTVDDDIESRLSSLENQNIRLNQKIKSYKDRGVRIVDNDRRTARQVFRDMRNGKTETH